MKRLLAIIFVLACLCPVTAWSVTYYVDPAASDDTNTGVDWAHAYKHMVKAESVAANGDTVRVKSGTCTEPSAVGGSTGCIAFAKALTWIADDGLGGAGSVTVRRASGTVGATIGAASAPGSNSISWTGFVFDGEGTAAYVLNAATGAASSVQTNKGFTNCNVKDSAHSGWENWINWNQTGGSATLTDCTFSGTTSQGIAPSASTLTLVRPTISSTTTNAHLMSPGTAGIIAIHDGSATLTGTQKLYVGTNPMTGTITVGDGFTLNSTAAADTFTLAGAALEVAGSTLNIQYSLFSSSNSASAKTVQYNTINYGGSNPTAIMIGSNTSMLASNPLLITDNIININASTGSNYAIQFASIDGDVSVLRNRLTVAMGITSAGGISLNDVTRPIVSDNTIDNHYLTSYYPITVGCAGKAFSGTAHVDGNTIWNLDHSFMSIRFGSDVASNAGCPGACNRIFNDHYGVGSTLNDNTIYGYYYISGVANAGYVSHGIFAGNQKKIEISRNLVVGTGDCIVVKAAGAADWNHVGGVYNNICVNNTYVGGIYIKGTQNVSQYNNTIYVSPGLPGTGQPQNQSAANSDDIYDCNGNPSACPSTGTHVFNDVIYGNAGVNAYLVDSYSLAGFAADHNIYYNATGAAQAFSWNGGSVTGFANWATASGETNSVFADPHFVSSSAGNFHRTIGTPAGAATSLTVDFDGKALPTPAGYPIGAYGFWPQGGSSMMIGF